MEWPLVDTRKTFQEIEDEYGIRVERDDMQPSGYCTDSEPRLRGLVRRIRNFLMRLR